MVISFEELFVFKKEQLHLKIMIMMSFVRFFFFFFRCVSSCRSIRNNKRNIGSTTYVLSKKKRVLRYWSMMKCITWVKVNLRWWDMDTQSFSIFDFFFSHHIWWKINTYTAFRRWYSLAYEREKKTFSMIIKTWSNQSFFF